MTVKAVSAAHLLASIASAASRPYALTTEGDSITWLDRNSLVFPQTVYNTWGDWVSRLSFGQMYLQNNPALPGRKAADVLLAFDGDTFGQVAPGWVGVLIGTNDARANGPLGTYAQNITQLVAKVQARGLRPFLCTIPPSGVPGLGTPPAPTLVQFATGGTLAAGTYTYAVSYRRPNSTESIGSATAQIVISSGTTNRVFIIPAIHGGAAGYGYYGRTGGAVNLLSRFAGTAYSSPATLTFIDDGSITPNVSFPAPVSDTSAISPVFPAAVSAINSWLRQFARDNAIPLVDFNALLTEPITGLYNSWASRDGIHPSPDGSYKMGQLVLQTLSPYLPPAIPNAASAHTNDAANFFANPLCQGTFGTNWTTSNIDVIPGVTAAYVTKTGFLGQALQLHVPYTGNNSAGVAVQSLGIANAAGNFQAGDVLEHSMLLKVENSNGARIQVIIEDGSANQMKTHSISIGAQSSIGPMMLTDRFVSNGNNIIYRIQADLGACDVYAGQFALRNLTRQQGVLIP